MSERSDAIVRTPCHLTHARHRKRPRALVKDRTLQTLVADLVTARTAAGMTQQEVAIRMWTTKSAVSRLKRLLRATDPGYDRNLALAVDARVEIRVRPRR